MITLIHIFICSDDKIALNAGFYQLAYMFVSVIISLNGNKILSFDYQRLNGSISLFISWVDENRDVSSAK